MISPVYSLCCELGEKRREGGFEVGCRLSELLRSLKASTKESEGGLLPSSPPSPPALEVEKRWWSEGELVCVWVLSLVVLRRRRSAMADGEEG